MRRLAGTTSPRCWNAARFISAETLLRAVQPDDRRFASHVLPPVNLLAACHPALPLGKGGAIEIAHLASHPLLLLGTGSVFRRLFDAVCRLAGLEPNVKFESQTPHTLLAMAESGGTACCHPVDAAHAALCLAVRQPDLSWQGVARAAGGLLGPAAALPPYATGFCEMLAAYVREVFPITRPSEPGTTAKRASVPRIGKGKRAKS